MAKFRFHQETLAESLETTVNILTKKELENIIRKKYKSVANKEICYKRIIDYTTGKPYNGDSFDSRRWEKYYVKDEDGNIIGMLEEIIK